MLYEFKERITFKKAKSILGDFRENFIDLSFLHMRREYLSTKSIDNESNNVNNNNNI